MLFCPPPAILIKNTCFLFAIPRRRQNKTIYDGACWNNNTTLPDMRYRDYFDSQLVNYMDYENNITYMPLYLKETIQEHLDDSLDRYFEYEDDEDDELFYYETNEKTLKAMLQNYESDYGHPLFVDYVDRTFAYLLNFIILQFQKYFANVCYPIIPLRTIAPGGHDICLLLHPDYLKEIPIFHTKKGFSVQGWRLREFDCASEHVVDLIVCTVEPSYREVIICPVDYYQCQDFRWECTSNCITKCFFLSKLYILWGNTA